MTAITAGFDVPHRRRPAGGTTRPEVVVRLHPQGPARQSAPSASSLVREPETHPGTYPAAADLDQLTRAVHALVAALAPGLVADVSVRQPDIPRTTRPANAGTSTASLERGEGGHRTAAGQPQAPLAGDGEIQLDEISRTLLVDSRPVPLTRREFELLAHLASHPGVAMSRPELMSAVWHDRYLPGDRTVDVHIRRIRVKLGAYAHRLNTLRGYGYRFD